MSGDVLWPLSVVDLEVELRKRGASALGLSFHDGRWSALVYVRGRATVTFGRSIAEVVDEVLERVPWRSEVPS